MHEPIAEAAADGLHWMRGTPLLASRPDLNALRLPCGHTFTAVCLVYNWVRNGNVLCPVCRAGTKGAHLSTRHLPPTVRRPMCRHAREEHRRDMAQTIQENEDAARLLATEEDRWLAEPTRSASS